MSKNPTPILPYLAKDLSLLGREPVPVEERPARALGLLGDLCRAKKSLSLFLDTCTKCGACAEQCHTYLGTRDPYNIPARRVDLVRQVYKRYFTLSGRLFGGFEGAKAIDQETVDLWYKYFYQCNECRRCAVFCPFGIDTAEVTIAAREILAGLGLVPKFILGVAANAARTGNNMGIPKPALVDSAEFLEDELKEETGKAIRIPVDDEGAEVLFNPSSSDFFTNTDGLMGVAKMFHAAGTSWTISTDIIETANFGLFFDQETMRKHNQRLFAAARQLKVKRVVAGECGHGWRTWKNFTRELSGDVGIPVVHEVEEALQYIKEGRIRLDRSANPERVTYHDPCNMARAGDLIEEPREVLRAAAENFVEMTPNRERNFCCGGGSGLLMEEMVELRVKFGKAKADQVRATGAEVLVAPCAMCKAQLPLVMEHHKVEVQVKGIADLIGKALVL